MTQVNDPICPFSNQKYFVDCKVDQVGNIYFIFFFFLNFSKGWLPFKQLFREFISSFLALQKKVDSEKEREILSGLPGATVLIRLHIAAISVIFASPP